VKGFRSETEVLIAEVPVGNWYESGVRIVPEDVGK
jgi:phenylpyruvate tautomerase PptA (4-oxalocrotonate tautomerase family)